VTQGPPANRRPWWKPGDSTNGPCLRIPDLQSRPGGILARGRCARPMISARSRAASAHQLTLGQRRCTGVIQRRAAGKDPVEPDELIRSYGAEKRTNLQTPVPASATTPCRLSRAGTDLPRLLCASYPFHPYQLNLFQAGAAELAVPQRVRRPHIGGGREQLVALCVPGGGQASWICRLRPIARLRSALRQASAS